MSRTLQGCFNNVGIYTVRLIAIDGSTRDTMEKVDFIEVYDNPTVAFTPSANNGCDVLNVAFTNLSSSGAPISNILWDFGDGTQTMTSIKSYLSAYIICQCRSKL